MNHTSTCLIIGTGLIGGSIAKALRFAEPEIVILGVDSDAESLSFMQEENVITEGFTSLTSAFALHTPNIIIIATPPHAWQETAALLQKQDLSHIKLMMDVGSIKHYALECFGQLPCFVPAHPIAGSQFSGAAFSTGELFHGKQVILTPTHNTDESLIVDAMRFWQKLGAEATRMEAEMHDAIYAYVSHLPQFTAYAIGLATLPQLHTEESYLRFLRLAGSSPALWLGIFQHNPYVAEAAETFLRLLGHMLAELHNGELPAEGVPLDLSIALELCPRILASCLISCVTLQEKSRDIRMARYAGSGFADMTAPAITPPEEDLARISEHTNSVIAFLEMVEAHFRTLLLALKKREWESLHRLMEQAQQHYMHHLN